MQRKRERQRSERTELGRRTTGNPCTGTSTTDDDRPIRTYGIENLEPGGVKLDRGRGGPAPCHSPGLLHESDGDPAPRQRAREQLEVTRLNATAGAVPQHESEPRTPCAAKVSPRVADRRSHLTYLGFRREGRRRPPPPALR